MKHRMSAFDHTAVEYGIAIRPLRGEIESGDVYTIIPHSRGALIAVIDGLGHGYEAALAAKVAVITLTRHVHMPLLDLVKSCHHALIKTRGVEMSIASLEWCDETMEWLSIGNVAGVLLRVIDQRSLDREYILMRNGVVGHRLPPLRAMKLRLQRGDLLIFATDGVREGYHSDVSLDASPQETADRILAEFGKTTDDALILVVRWNGPPVGAV
jgi:phosphoserine phosphatase RsbX